MSEFEMRNQGTLASIELAIVECFRAQSGLTDHDIEEAINAVLPAYEPTKRDTSGRVARLGPMAREVFTHISAVCRVMSDPDKLETEAGVPLATEMRMKSVNAETMSACLKRIRKSVQFWRRDGGLRGYLNFISQNI
jgi:hypothetical protein